MIVAETPASTHLRIRPIRTAIGAVIEGAELDRPLTSRHVAQIREALLDRGVVFFRGQELNDTQMGAFIAHFGEHYG